MPRSANAARETRPAYSAPALEKGLEILELLATILRPISMREIAERLGRSKGEIFRVVFVLVDRGYLVRDAASDELTLSNRLFDLGMRTPFARELTEIAVPAMDRLSRSCGQSAHLVVIHGGETVVVASTTAQSEISFALKIGYRRPAIDATSGKVIMAFQEPARRRAILDAATKASGRAPVCDPAELDAELDAIAARGYLVAESHDVVGVTDIAAPVLDRNGSALASIVVPYLNRHGIAPRHEDVLSLLLECSGAIREALK